MKKYKHPNFENITSVTICQLKHVGNLKLLPMQTCLLSFKYGQNKLPYECLKYQSEIGL